MNDAPHNVHLLSFHPLSVAAERGWWLPRFFETSKNGRLAGTDRHFAFGSCQSLPGSFPVPGAATSLRLPAIATPGENAGSASGAEGKEQASTMHHLLGN